MARYGFTLNNPKDGGGYNLYYSLPDRKGMDEKNMSKEDVILRIVELAANYAIPLILESDPSLGRVGDTRVRKRTLDYVATATEELGLELVVLRAKRK